MADLLSIEAIGITFSVLKATPLYNAVNGKFFKGSKTKNFTGECVVINALPMTGSQHQLCIVNVNVFVPNLKLPIPGSSPLVYDQTQANYPRMAALSKMVSAVLREYHNENHSLEIEQEYPLENEGFNEHYINFRVRFRNVNI